LEPTLDGATLASQGGAPAEEIWRSIYFYPTLTTSGWGTHIILHSWQ